MREKEAKKILKNPKNYHCKKRRNMELHKNLIDLIITTKAITTKAITIPAKKSCKTSYQAQKNKDIVKRNIEIIYIFLHYKSNNQLEVRKQHLKVLKNSPSHLKKKMHLKRRILKI